MTIGKNKPALYNEIFASLHLPSTKILQKQIDCNEKLDYQLKVCDRLKDISQDTLVVVRNSRSDNTS